MSSNHIRDVTAVSVTAYGADPTGATDSTAAFNQAPTTPVSPIGYVPPSIAVPAGISVVSGR